MSRQDFMDQESSGGLANFTLTVDEAYFAIDQQYSERAGGDVYFLHWTGRTDIPDRPLMSSADFHPKWSLDPDFVSLDGGKTVVSQSGRKNKVGKAYGRMCAAAATATDRLKDTPEDFLAGADPKDASIWVGTTWRLDNITRDWGGEIGKRDELMPVEYIGKAGAAPAAPTAPAAAAPIPAAAPAQNGGVRQSIEALASGAADYRTFQQAALQIPGVADDTALVQEILDSGPTGLYARVHG